MWFVFGDNQPAPRADRPVAELGQGRVGPSKRFKAPDMSHTTSQIRGWQELG